MTDTLYGSLSYPYEAFEGATESYKRERVELLQGDPDTLAARELSRLYSRISHAIRNNGYATIARDKFVMNLGDIKVNWKGNKGVSKGKTDERMQEYWDEFADSPNLDGYGDLKNTQSLWFHSFFSKGAAFSQFQIRRTNAKIPLKLKAIPVDYHDIFFNGDTPESIKNTRNGIKFNDTKPEIYYFRKGIYDGNFNVISNNPYDRVPIPAKELLHIFARTEAAQWLGIPVLTPVLISLYELDELTDATVAKQKAAQAISWIIENTNPMSMTPAGVPVTTKDSNNNEKIIFKTQGGNVQYLNKGEKINFYQSTDIGSNLPVLINSELRKIAAAVGIPFYQLTGDTSGLDFSSLRAIAIELRNRVEYILHFYIISLAMKPLTSYFLNLTNLYDPRVKNVSPSFQLRRWYGVDELKDTQADLLEVQSGMATLQSKLDERHTSFEEITQDRERMKELGLEHMLKPSGKNTSQMDNKEANSNSSSN